MINNLDFISLPTLFFILLTFSVLSGLILLYPRIPLGFVRFHTGIIILPPIIALFALIFNNERTMFGPFRLDSLSWLLAMFVLTIGFIVQRYSIRYLFGDRNYRKYFALLTLTTVVDSVAWMSDDLRFLLICWGATLLGLTLLIRLKKEWRVARKSANLSGLLFALSWLSLLFAIIWLSQATGHWRLLHILTEDSLAQLASWEKTCINLLLIGAVVIPAAQWPLQRWLLESVVAPTPISAVMHAGIVNAGGIILTCFAPLFSGNIAQIILLVLSSISVLIGTGIMLVQVDYKRQLVGSTIAQMGFMLIQCALGAYVAAITHAVLHGLFKSTLFLRAGTVITTEKSVSKRSTQSSTFLWVIAGGVLGTLIGIAFWLTSHGEVYQFISAVILGWSVSIAWKQFMAFGKGPISRLVGFLLFAGTSIVFSVIHNAFYNLLHGAVNQGVQPPISAAIWLLLILLLGHIIGAWLSHNRSTVAYAVIYLWLLRLSEPQNGSVESHPKYLTQSRDSRRYVR
ncbi:NADH dehydrogenase subunit 5 [Terrilactibacillus sp. BCM23-1]|uniref:Probable inorganic carbon transporter subunit DabB n=1 Tax=Terrilactibacillus tamarindi TaxID=2599694 RepID=A0A6N8CN01_9BACI|nr:NADH dehydrogenase subunit 5 [Terrilactibacillus tamarindi]MTT30463.1 NADH dehydrogenase subunit 5 [Terrilactibacillus tamarindi]